MPQGVYLRARPAQRLAATRPPPPRPALPATSPEPTACDSPAWGCCAPGPAARSGRSGSRFRSVCSAPDPAPWALKRKPIKRWPSVPGAWARPVLSHPNCMMQNMHATDIPSPADLYRHRYAFDAIKKAALYASNQLGAMSSTLLVPAEWKPIHDRANVSRKILKGVLKELRDSQIQYQRDLPSLSPESAMSLKALDKNIVAHESGAHPWFLSHHRGHGSEGSKAGDWIFIDESIWLGFNLRPELDPVSAETTELYLSWRFANLEVRSCPDENGDKKALPPFFRFGKWADDHFPADRPEVTGLRSELLKAFLPHVPELGFVAAYVFACTLTLERGTTWQASLSD